MAVELKTNDPQQLLSSIKKAIDAGHIQTWSYDADGDFTHTATQWKGLAWLRPRQNYGTLVLNIFGRKGQRLSSEVYAIYHGRFIEMAVAHFDRLFSSGEATAMPTVGDNVGS